MIWRLAVFCALLLAGYLLWHTVLAAAAYVRIARGLRSVPAAPGSHWLLGHVLVLLKAVPWDLMCDWVVHDPPLLKVNLSARQSTSAQALPAHAPAPGAHPQPGHGPRGQR